MQLPDLDTLLRSASEASAKTLFLIPGQPIGMRVFEEVTTPFGETRLTFHDTQAYAADLVPASKAEELEAQGDTEFEFRRGGLSGKATVYFGQGAHHLVIKLGA